MNDSFENKKRAAELIDLMKKGTLSLEQLKELVPMTTEFLKELCGVLKEEIVNSRQSHAEAMQALEKAIDALKEIGKEENCSDDLRKAIIERIGDIANMVRELQKTHEGNTNSRYLWIIAIIGSIVALTLMLSSNSNNSSQSYHHPIKS